MSKIAALRILNPAMAVLIVVQAVSGLLPSLIPYEVHRTVGIALVPCVGLHLYLNWGWVRVNILKRRNVRPPSE